MELYTVKAATGSGCIFRIEVMATCSNDAIAQVQNQYQNCTRFFI